MINRHTEEVAPSSISFYMDWSYPTLMRWLMYTLGLRNLLLRGYFVSGLAHLHALLGIYGKTIAPEKLITESLNE